MLVRKIAIKQFNLKIIKISSSINSLKTISFFLLIYILSSFSMKGILIKADKRAIFGFKDAKVAEPFPSPSSENEFKWAKNETAKQMKNKRKTFRGSKHAKKERDD